MELSRIWRSVMVGLLFLVVTGTLSARGPFWKPERKPGSAQLAPAEISLLLLPNEPSEALLAAVEDLVELWPAELEIVRADEATGKGALILMRDTRCGMRDEGFVIRRDRTKVHLRACTDEGLVNGIYAICHDLLAARWYWSGELGFEQVGPVGEKFPDRIWWGRPAFAQRTLHPVNTDFGRRNRLNRKFSFNHNLARIFSEAVFETHPEVFAEIGGVRRRPRGHAGTDPQPDFTEPKAVELAAEAARRHFEDNPGTNSFSLSINDNSLYDEGPETEAVVRGGASKCEGVNVGTVFADASTVKKYEGEVEYFRGRPNYTDLVFGFMNRVAERLEKAEGGELRPEGFFEQSRRSGNEEVWNQCNFLSHGLLARLLQVSGLIPQPSQPYLTALAYYTTEQSPSFELHPRVMPVLTSDRAQWHDPEYRAEDKALIKRWANSGAERIATWDYYFGAPYPYPRQFNLWIGESIDYLHDQGVDVFFSQLPSVWGLDGPKAWLAAQLLWDPEQDVAALLDEFYTNFFGPAAQPMREFYEIAERTRNEREGTANWIKFYKDEAGIELFDPATLRRMRECIERAASLAEEGVSCGVVACDGPDPSRRLPFDKLMALSLSKRQASTPHMRSFDRYAERVRIVSEAFAYTESYADYHQKRVRLVELALEALRSNADSIDVERLSDALAAYADAKAAFQGLSGRLVKQPMHSGFSVFNRLLKSDPIPLTRVALARSSADLQAEGLPFDSMPLPILDSMKGAKPKLYSVSRNTGLVHSGTELRNFLGPQIPVIEHWDINYRASEGLVIAQASANDSTGLRVENADIVSLEQTFPVASEKFYLLEIHAAWQVSPDNRTRVQLNWTSISGDKLRTDILLRLPNGRSAGVQPLKFIIESPIKAYDVRLGIVANRQYDGDFLEIHRVEFGEVLRDRDQNP